MDHLAPDAPYPETAQWLEGVQLKQSPTWSAQWPAVRRPQQETIGSCSRGLGSEAPAAATVRRFLTGREGNRHGARR